MRVKKKLERKEEGKSVENDNEMRCVYSREEGEWESGRVGGLGCIEVRLGSEMGDEMKE